MALIHTWSITELKREHGEDGVQSVSWKLETTDDADPAYNEMISSEMRLHVNYDDVNYVAFADLTEEICLNWVWGVLDKDALEAKHSSPSTPAFDTDLPW